MKILFAVSNENVSKRIAESYRQKYQEDVSSKNVFYFNAIIREIKNDKTYDRIVISEDLEPFSNSNYDVIDRFILERLKEISYEASALEKRPDIIVICTDRRTKSGYVLSKMHEYGIYNALVGTDRKIDAVCDLLNRPRTSQEAKEYYKIEGTQTDTSSVDDVTEQEVQNILIHYKRLGKNEDRYTDSFNNIAAQYTDKQLKIIIKCLPINVRAVLEAECPKYQELVTYADESEEEKAAKAKIQEQRRMEQIENDRKLKQKIEKEKKEALRKAQKESEQPIHQQAPQVQTQLRSGIDLLDNKNAQPRMTGNVIIPNNMNIKNERKIYSDEELQAINNTPRERRMGNIAQPTQQIEQESVQNNQHNSTKPVMANEVAQTNQNIQQEATLPGLEDVTFPETNISGVESNSLPGVENWDADPFAENAQQANQNIQQEATLPGLEDITFPESNVPEIENTKINNVALQPESLETSSENIENNMNTVTEPIVEKMTENQLQMPDVTSIPEVPQPPKRGRGRPRKYPIEPPKPKGKRGRPRKNPLPEEAQIEKEEQTITSQTSEKLPVQAQSTQLTEVEEPKAPIPTMVPNNQNVILENETINQQDYQKTILQNEMPNQSYNGYSQNIQQEATLPGMEDWNTDPFAESTVQTTQNMQQEATLPGVNDWDADPFAENDNSLPGIDNSVGYELENNSDTLSSSVVNPYNTNATTNYQQNYDYNQASTGYGTNNNYNQVDNYNQANNGYNPNSTLNQYDNQTNNGYEQNNSYNQQNTGYNQSGIGFAQQDNYNEQVSSYSPSQERKESLQKIEENRLYSTGSLNSILTKDKKIVAFVGASKSGTSFLVNNLACLFSSIGVKTAILDMTSNKNSYFIYTNNDENLRNIAYSSIENLENGIAEGIRVDRNLNVYTSIPNDGKDYSNAEAILSTLVQNESLILIDCDFTTDLGYLANAQEIYLVQSMDILTIQPLTAFLRDLKTKGILEQEKLRVVINKEVKVKGLSSKAVIGGMSFYNDPAMSYMTELFNKEKIRACSIPFDEGVYSKYLESIVNCVITISGYNKSFMNSLKILGNMVYPLLSKQTYNTKSSAEANYGNNFSAEMNNTLNQMKNKY